MKRYLATLALALSLSVSPLAVHAADEWLLMARHGECFEIDKLERKIPELEGVKDPHSFVELMRKRGHVARVTEMPGLSGKAVEVNVPDRELGIVFVTREVCQRLSGHERK